MPGADDDDATPAPFPNANGAWDEGVNPFFTAAERHSVKALRFLANSRAYSQYYVNSPLQVLGNGLDAPRMAQTLLRGGSGSSDGDHAHVAWLWFVAPHLRRYDSFGHEANEVAALREVEAATDVDEATRATARAMLVLSSLQEEQAAEND